jgi:purine nucleosidase
MKKIIFDCDNTLGISGCDVDDGLALLYLLGCSEAEVCGITTTYGNHEIDIVYPNTKQLLEEIGHKNIIVKKGGSRKGEYENEASVYLAEMVHSYPGQISILATGSLTNLQGAYEIDSHFFEKVKEIVLMGGVTAPLIFAKKEMDELNFSCDPSASYHVLKYGRNLSVITGNNCLKVLFTRKEYHQELFQKEKKIAEYIRNKTDYWFGDNQDGYGIEGFYNWDVTAAVYLMHPELFEKKERYFTLSQKDLNRGYLREGQEGTLLNLPEIKEAMPFKRNIYDTWLKVTMD